MSIPTFLRSVLSYFMGQIAKGEAPVQSRPYLERKMNGDSALRIHFENDKDIVAENVKIAVFEAFVAKYDENLIFTGKLFFLILVYSLIPPICFSLRYKNIDLRPGTARVYVLILMLMFVQMESSVIPLNTPTADASVSSSVEALILLTGEICT